MFRKALHIAFFSTAFLLIQAHAFIPHGHGNEAESTEWLGILSGLADLDLGSSHLENYKPEKTSIKIDLEFNAEIILVKELFFIVKVSNSFPLPSDIDFTREYPYDHFYLRGPPALV